MLKIKVNWYAISNFVQAVSIIIGTIIGAGMFGIPYVVSKAGFPFGFLLIIFLGIVVIILNLTYGEVILRTRGKHQFTGYAEKYLGEKGKLVALFALLTGLYGGLIAYIIKVGELLDFLLPLPEVTSPFFWSFLFFVTMSLAVLIGLKMVSGLDTFLTFVLVIAFLVLSIFLFPEISQAKILRQESDLKNLFLPYGVILFSLGGASILGEVKSVLGNKSKYKQVILWGTVVPIVIYFIFAVMVVGVTGLETSDDAIRGLNQFNPTFAMIGAILAILTMSTSFLGLATILTAVFHQDFKVPYFWAWFLTVMPPFLIFTLGLNSFIMVIGIAGGIMAGTEGIIILLMHEKAKKLKKVPAYEINFPKAFRYFLFSIFILGIIYELLKIFGLL